MQHRCVLALAASLALAPAGASAQGSPAGSVHAHLLASPQADVGGALSADLHYALDIFRIGGFAGVGVIPSADDAHNRVFAPVGPSIGLEVMGDVVGFALRIRGGLWVGATQEVKITAGGFVGGGVYLLFALGSGVGLGVGLDVWGLFGDGETALVAPGVGLTWNPMDSAI